MSDPNAPLLKVVEGPEAGNSLSLVGRSRLVIGRRTNADFQILDPGISGLHCEIIHDDSGQYTLADLESSNGTFLNGRQVERASLRHRDIIHMGQSSIQFLGDETQTPNPASVDTVVVADQWKQSDSDIIERYSATGSFKKFLDAEVQSPHQLKRALESIYQVAVSLADVSNLDDRLHQILNLILESYQADRGCIVLTMGDGDAYEIVASADNGSGTNDRFEVSHTILVRTLQGRDAILTLDLPASEMFDSSQSIGEQRVKSIMCVPIATQQRQLGALYFDSLSRIGAFNRDDLQLLTCVARLVGESIEKERLTKEAERTREQLRVVLEEAPVGVFSLDQNLKFDVWTGHLTRLLGYTPGEARGRGLGLIVPDPKISIMLEQAEQKGSFEGEMQCRRKDGSSFRARLALAPLPAPGDTNLRIIGCLTDISVREKLKRELMEQQKLASLGLLVAGITHDLKNFLTSLYGTAQLAEKFPRYQEQLVTTALTTSQSSVALIDNLLGFVGGNNAWEELALGDMVEQTLKLIETQLRHTEIQVVRELEDAPKIRARKSFVQDMLLNLILNARKAMPKGGTLRIGVSTPIEGHVRMKVSDNGIGIEPDKLSHIFDPFFTQQKAMGGTGLGLYMVQHIVEDHDGKISVESEVGQGTTFVIDFPIASDRDSREDTAAITVGHHTRQFTMVRQIQVLIGELDADTISHFSDAMGRNTWDQAGDLPTVLDLASRSRYDAVFLSSSLPGNPGVEAAYAQLCEATTEVYLLHGGDGTLPTGLQSIDRMLLRPLHPEELKLLLERLARPGGLEREQR